MLSVEKIIIGSTLYVFFRSQITAVIKLSDTSRRKSTWASVCQRVDVCIGLNRT